MKKLYYKVSSFFTEKRSTIILLLMVLSVLFIPKNTYALDVTGYASESWIHDFTSKLNNFFNYDKLLFYSTSNAPSNTSYLYFIPLNSSDTLCRTSATERTLLVNGTTTRIFTVRFDKIDDMTFSNLVSEVGSSTNTQSSTSRVFSNFDVNYCDTGGLFKNMRFEYTPPTSGANCPICEECTECVECEEVGPVEVSNFPFDKTEFYALLVLLGVLIIMLFFKWCFPMKGGKKTK